MSSPVRMQSPSLSIRFSLADLNPHLTCVLCNGYMVDATTIIECLHSFCHTCIYNYLSTSKYCPICDVQVHKTKPLLNIRPDKTMQSMVYKLVPGLLKDEMRRRREFYATHPQHSPSEAMLLNSPEEHALLADETCSVVSPLDKEECVSVCLQLSDRLPPLSKASSSRPRVVQPCKRMKNDRRYLLCPASLTVGHLKRFLRVKLELPAHLDVDIFHTDELLQESFSLRDIANIYTWRRTEPLKLYYVITGDEHCKSFQPRIEKNSSRQIIIPPEHTTISSKVLPEHTAISRKVPPEPTAISSKVPPEPIAISNKVPVSEKRHHSLAQKSHSSSKAKSCSSRRRLVDPIYRRCFVNRDDKVEDRCSQLQRKSVAKRKNKVATPKHSEHRSVVSDVEMSKELKLFDPSCSAVAVDIETETSLVKVSTSLELSRNEIVEMSASRSSDVVPVDCSGTNCSILTVPTSCRDIVPPPFANVPDSDKNSDIAKTNADDCLIADVDMEEKLVALITDTLEKVPRCEDGLDLMDSLPVDNGNKIGFEADAVVGRESSWSSPPERRLVVMRRVRKSNGEVRRLLLDESAPGWRRQLRGTNNPCRKTVVGFVRSKFRRSPLLRLRSIVRLRNTAASLTGHTAAGGKLVPRRKIVGNAQIS